jgi:hypothetical protein
MCAIRTLRHKERWPDRQGQNDTPSTFDSSGTYDHTAHRASPALFFAESEVQMREPRKPINVAVRVVGLDARGHTYSHSVNTVNVSAHGMRIHGASFLRKTGEIVTVVYGANRLKFRVVWIGPPGTPLEDQAALAVAALNEDIGKLGLLVPPEVDELEAGTSPSAELGDPFGQRHSPRYACDRGVQVWKQGEIVAIYGKLHNLSMTGCYIESPQPFPVGTAVRIAMSLFGMQVRAQGVVRSSFPAKGIGVQFTSVRPEDITLLNSVLGRLAKGAASGES